MKKEIQIPCMFDPTKICSENCRLYRLNLLGIYENATSQGQVEIAISELKLQPTIRARAHELVIQRIDPFIGLGCELKKTH